MSELISILTPFKNTAAYLAECVKSIQSQTYTNWVLFLIDDHSSDESWQIAETLSQSDKRIQLLKNRGSGIIEALRTGFELAKGTKITRMDSDDIMPGNKLEVLSKMLDKCGTGHVAIGQVKYFSSDAITEGYQNYEQWLNKLTTTGTNFNEIYKECPIPSPNWLVFKDDLVRCGDFQPNLYPEDYDLAFRFYKHGLKCIPCSTLTHKWRDYPNRTSKTSAHYAIEAFMKLKIRYFLEVDYIDSRPLTVWGAGEKGKVIANYLVKHNIPFHWISHNPGKIAQSIYGQELRDMAFFSALNGPQSIVTVANEGAQQEIGKYMRQRDMQHMRDYYFFC